MSGSSGGPLGSWAHLRPFNPDKPDNGGDESDGDESLPASLPDLIALDDNEDERRDHHSDRVLAVASEDESLPPDFSEVESLPSDFDADVVNKECGRKPCCLRRCLDNPTPPPWVHDFQALKGKHDQDLWLFVNLRGDILDSCCKPALRSWLGISHVRYDKLRQAIKSGSLEPSVDGRSHRTDIRVSAKAEDVDRFFLWIYTDWAEPMPTADIDGHMKERGQTTNAKLAEVRKLLGHTMSQSELLKLGPRHMERMTVSQLKEMHGAWTTGERVSGETIRHGLKNWECLIRPRSMQTTHKPCARCAELKLRRKKAATHQELQAIALELGQHRDDISADRRVYKHICTLSEKATREACTMQDPATSYLSFVIDGMDQSKFMCPRNIAASKLWDSFWRPQLGFIGVLVHGVCEIFYVLEPGLQKSGSTIVEVLARSLERVKDILAQRGISMPRHIQLQLDNTTRENKNQTVFKFLTHLTSMFDTCGVNFFEVGHTHLDLDQRFSVVGPVIASAEELETPTDFANRISYQYQPLAGHSLHVEVMESIRDWKLWLTNFSEDISGHTGKTSAHSFKLIRYKNLDPSWLELKCQNIDERGDPQADDRLLLVKSFMRDLIPLQNPLVVLRGDHAPLDASQLTVLNMKAGGEREIKEYRKTAAILASDPWNLTRAASWLQRTCQMWEDDAPGDLAPLTFVFEKRECFDQVVPLQEFCEAVDIPCNPIQLKPKAKPKAKRKAKAKGGAKGRPRAKACAAALDAGHDESQASDEGSHSGEIAVDAEMEELAASEELLAVTTDPYGAEPTPLRRIFGKRPRAVARSTGASADMHAEVEPEVPDMHAEVGSEVPVAASSAGSSAGIHAAVAHEDPGAPPRRVRKLKSDPPVPLGCSRCRKCRVGCKDCRRKAGIDHSPGRRWHNT